MAALEERLSRPDDGVVAALRACPGDVLVLGAGGKMGPSLARMAWRAAQAAGDGRRVIAVARWHDPAARTALDADGVTTLACDLEDPAALAALPDAPNIIYMAGQKFGTQDAPSRTWALNAVLPARCLARWPDARWVAFSTGNVYALARAAGPFARETDLPAPIGEYAMSCLGRERAFEDAALLRGTRSAIVRLNYAVDLRYGVLVDIGRRVRDGEPVDVTMGWVNVIWQGDANRMALRLLAHASAPPCTVNVTGPERLSVRDVAERFGGRLGILADVRGAEAPEALLSDTTRMHELLGAPEIQAPVLIEWVAAWLERRNPLLAKPTRFEVRDGAF
ncbi:MAG: epimerase [Gemmatimonadetes bacterium]|nr:epimerase [Gemmatimonadota bacterium]